MARYFIESPHTPAECMQALDEFVAQGPKTLEKVHFGCMAGNHTGWAITEAENESAARNMLPDSLRSKARIVKVDQFTPEQIESFHKK